MPIRVSKEQLDVKRAEITRKKDTIAHLKVLSSGKNTEFWKKLGETVKTAKDNCEKAILDLAQGNSLDKDLEYIKLKSLGGQLKAYSNVFSSVDGADSLIQSLEDTIMELKNKISKVEENNGVI